MSLLIRVKKIPLYINRNVLSLRLLASGQPKPVTERRAGEDREAEQAHRRVSGGQSRSKCAARVRSSPYRYKDIELLKAETNGTKERQKNVRLL